MPKVLVPDRNRRRAARGDARQCPAVRGRLSQQAGQSHRYGAAPAAASIPSRGSSPRGCAPNSGQPFVIENKGGAGGNIAAESVFQAEPDGYTLMASQPAPITTNVVLYKKLNFDPTAFEPVAIMSSAPNVLLVKNDFPAKTLAGVHDLCEGQSRQAELRVAGTGHDLASDRRAVQQARRHQARPTCPTRAPAPRSTTSSPATST